MTDADYISLNPIDKKLTLPRDAKPSYNAREILKIKKDRKKFLHSKSAFVHSFRTFPRSALKVRELPEYDQFDQDMNDSSQPPKNEGDPNSNDS